MYVQVCMYIHLKYAHMTLLYLCVCIYYWLPTVWYGTVGEYLSWCDIHLCIYHVDMDIFKSMYVCCYITTVLVENM